MKTILSRYAAVLRYLFFGVLTTVINILVYTLCYEKMQISNMGSTVIAWVAAVLFAFITNKQYVFRSKDWKWKTTAEEGIKFTGGRLSTGVMELVVMYVAVDLMGFPGIVMKTAVNVLVIVLNYAISKRWIFQTGHRQN